MMLVVKDDLLDESARNIQRFNQRYNWATQKVEYVNLVDKLGRRL